MLGTAAYMAPEQLEGGDVGPAADIYALAAITFEALSGRKPREGTTPIEIAHKLATEGPPDLSAAWPKAPPAAVEVLKRGMARDPADRPESAGEFARELAEALKDEPTKTAPTRRFRPAAAGHPPAPATDTTPRPRQRRRRHAEPAHRRSGGSRPDGPAGSP